MQNGCHTIVRNVSRTKNDVIKIEISKLLL